jgi:hypothetical protein
MFLEGWARLRSTPTYLQCELTFNLDDYGKKESITAKLSRAAKARRLAMRPCAKRAQIPAGVGSSDVLGFILYFSNYSKMLCKPKAAKPQA